MAEEFLYISLLLEGDTPLVFNYDTMTCSEQQYNTPFFCSFWQRGVLFNGYRNTTTYTTLRFIGRLKTNFIHIVMNDTVVNFQVYRIELLYTGVNSSKSTLEFLGFTK